MGKHDSFFKKHNQGLFTLKHARNCADEAGLELPETTNQIAREYLAGFGSNTLINWRTLRMCDQYLQNCEYHYDLWGSEPEEELITPAVASFASQIFNLRLGLPKLDSELRNRSILSTYVPPFMDVQSTIGFSQQGTSLEKLYRTAVYTSFCNRFDSFEMAVSDPRTSIDFLRALGVDSGAEPSVILAALDDFIAIILPEQDDHLLFFTAVMAEILGALIIDATDGERMKGSEYGSLVLTGEKVVLNPHQMILTQASDPAGISLYKSSPFQIKFCAECDAELMLCN